MWRSSVFNRSEALWANTTVGYVFIFAGAMLAAFWWWFGWPSPGVSIAVMGVAVAMMAGRTRPSGLEKSVWMVLIFLLLVIEVLAIRKDRTQQETAFSVARQKENQQFQKIADGITLSMDRSQAQFNTTMLGLNENLRTMTGGTSFCFLTAVEDENNPSLVLFAFHHGRYPIHGVGARLVDLQRFTVTGLRAYVL